MPTHRDPEKHSTAPFPQLLAREREREGHYYPSEDKRRNILDSQSPIV